MSKANDKQNGGNKLRHRQDILRAKDIIPGAQKISSQISKTHKGKKHISSADASTKQKASEIPKFDLVEEIMAEHRKISATKRKAPGQKVRATEQKPLPNRQDALRQLIIYPPQISQQELFEQQKIVAEIVARDIENLCGSNS